MSTSQVLLRHSSFSPQEARWRGLYPSVENNDSSFTGASAFERRPELHLRDGGLIGVGHSFPKGFDIALARLKEGTLPHASEYSVGIVVGDARCLSLIGEWLESQLLKYGRVEFDFPSGGPGVGFDN